MMRPIMRVKSFDILTRYRAAAAVALAAGLPLILLGLTSGHWASLSSRGPQHYTKAHDSRHGSVRIDDLILRRLCEESHRSTVTSSYSHWDLERNDPGAWQEVERGMKRLERLLPLAKRLTLESLQRLSADFGISPNALQQAERHVKAIERIALDPELGNSAEVSDEFPSEVHLGPSFALDVTTDEDAALLLGHELTHVATWGESLGRFIDGVAQTAQLTAGVYPTLEQREDLACDFVGAEVAKRLIQLYPNDEPAARRFARLLDYNCGSNADEDSDEEHLSQADTLRALLGLDAELTHLILKR